MHNAQSAPEKIDTNKENLNSKNREGNLKFLDEVIDNKKMLESLLTNLVLETKDNKFLIKLLKKIEKETELKLKKKMFVKIVIDILIHINKNKGIDIPELNNIKDLFVFLKKIFSNKAVSMSDRYSVNNQEIQNIEVWWDFGKEIEISIHEDFTYETNFLI